MRILEQQRREETLYQLDQEQRVARVTDLYQQNEVSLQRMRKDLQVAITMQETQVEALTTTLATLQDQIRSLTPRLKQMESIREKHEMLRSRMDGIEMRSSQNALRQATEKTFHELEMRMDVLEERIQRMGKGSVGRQEEILRKSATFTLGHGSQTNTQTNHSSILGRISRSPPPPPPTTPPPSSFASLRQQVRREGTFPKDESRNEEKVVDDHFIPHLRKAFATPKLPAFVLKAILSRPKPKSGDIVSSLPPFTHL